MNALTTAVRLDEKAEQLARLREWFPKGSTVYTIIRHVARSGCSRVIGIVSLAKVENEIGNGINVRHPNHATSVVLGLRRSKDHDGVHISGGGMDMGFAIAYDISRVLYGDGYALRHEWL